MDRHSQERSADRSARWGKVIMAGFFGALAPNLMQAATQALHAGSDPLLIAQLPFWTGATIVAGLGALLVYFYDERSAKRAVALGAAAPAFILGLTQGLQTAPLSDPSATGPDAGVVDSAKHVPVTWKPARGWAVLATGPRFAIVRTTGLERARRVDLVTVSGERVTLHPVRRASVTVRLPVGTGMLYVTADGITSERISLSGVRGDTVMVAVSVRPSGLRSFGRAFGIRNAGGLRVTVELTAMAQPRVNGNAA